MANLNLLTVKSYMSSSNAIIDSTRPKWQTCGTWSVGFIQFIHNCIRLSIATRWLQPLGSLLRRGKDT